MNVPSLQLSDPVISLSKDHGSIRKVKRSTSLRKSDQEVNYFSKSSSQSSSTDKLSVNEIKAKRVENIAELRKIHNCLRCLLNDPNKRVILTEDNQLRVMPKDHLNHADINLAVIQFIYQKILRAMTSQIYYFFDERGFFVTLTEIDKLARIKYATIQSQTRHDVESNLADYYDSKPTFLWGQDIGNENEYIHCLMDLPLAKYTGPEKLPNIPEIIITNENSEKAVINPPLTITNDNLSEKKGDQQFAFWIFQKMYPLASVTNTDEDIPIMTPITFLCSYKKYLSTEELFEVAAKSISLPEKEMPYLQKLKVLNFIRVFLESHLYQNEPITRHMKSTIAKILKKGFVSDKVEFMDLCHEIYFLLEENERKCFNPTPISPSKVPYEIDKMLQIEQGKSHHYSSFLNALSDDIKFLSALEVSKLTVDVLFSDKNAGEKQLHYNKIVDFGVAAFIKHFDLMLKKPDAKAIKLKLQQYFTLFIDLGHELIKKHDYSSAFAVYSILILSQLNKMLLLPTTKQTKSTLSRHKQITILKSAVTEQKFLEMEELFSVNKNFEVLRNKMRECEELHIRYVPFLAPLKTELLHKFEEIENSLFQTEFLHILEVVEGSANAENGSKINNEKLKLIADLKWETNQTLENIRKNFRGQTITFSTDINEHLVIKDNTEKLDEIYEQIKFAQMVTSSG